MAGGIYGETPGAYQLCPQDWTLTEDQNRRSGLIILALVAVVGLLFTGGIARRSYWALALPVAAGVFSSLYVAFWIGRALLITRPREPEAAE
jgi:hypothetical protein